MNPRSYNLIFALLALCVLSVVCVQGFWIRNLYVQKTEAFNSSIYSALEQVTVKLQEREYMKVLGHTLLLGNGDTLVSVPGSTTVKSFSFENKGKGRKQSTIMISGNGNNVITRTTVTDSVFAPAQAKLKRINKKLTRITRKINTTKQAEQITAEIKELKDDAAGININAKEMTGEAQEMDQLIRKVLTELKVEKEAPGLNCDTVRSVIKQTLENKGIFVPFEFSLRNAQASASKTLCQSAGYLEAEKHYQADLSANKVFSTHDYLWLQFPGISGHVWAAMKSSLLLSLLFSLVILGAFYYTIRLILRQKKLGEIKNDFVNNMTHELKTPIATISLALDAISNPAVKNDEEKFADYSRILKEENRKLNNHVERVLQMALLDRGQLQLHRAPLNMVAVIRRSVATYQLQIQKQAAVVTLKGGEKEITVSADETHLLAVFNNLLDNALKYSGEKCVIEILIESSAREIIVRFRDSGIGIDTAMQEKVFEKFVRVQGGNLHDVKGFGLGLSYARSVIEAHGGSIGLNSEPWKGSEFIIRLQPYV